MILRHIHSATKSRNQSGEDKTGGVWQVSGDVLLVTRHSTHVPISKTYTKKKFLQGNTIPTEGH